MKSALGAKRCLVADLTPAQRTAENIAAHYGIDALAELVQGLTEDKPVPDLARRFGVSRQRVYQWKHALGVEVRSWTPRPDILTLLKE